MTENDKKKPEQDPVESTVVTSITQIDQPQDVKAYILFLAGPKQGKLFELTEDRTVVGRGDDANITINDQRVSRHHFEITMEAGAPVLSDMGSTNGTYINGQRVTRHELQNGDKIQISSSTIIKFGLGDEGERLFHDEFYNMANMDAATGIYNKQFFMKRLEEEFAYAKRQGGNMSLIMCDIDFFKKVNDTHGHMAGDFVLQQVAAALKDTVRGEDVLARYGGEEFIIILRQIDEEGAYLLGERIRERVAEKAMEFEGTKIPVTMSFGLASVEDTSIENPEALIAAADEFLYMSKEGGRNRTTSAHHKP